MKENKKWQDRNFISNKQIDEEILQVEIFQPSEKVSQAGVERRSGPFWPAQWTPIIFWSDLPQIKLLTKGVPFA